jgi:non-specific serine/threonine protein kinase/serine/threonine-protein kinase
MLAALDESIRPEVASLFEASEASPAFLRLPGDDEVGPGAMLGPYLLGAEIGRGGMGVVFAAERRDGEFTRQVAIKIAGGRMFGPEAERRFIQERQILAQIDHPHVVRLIDGGITGGRRYFVMELASGMPITDYCQSKVLPLTARLALFRDVCDAIHYAHQRLILHRDLKASNIIVTADAQVKVLDFGIAQLVQDDASTSDATGMHPYSLACASPEQMRGEPLSLASDIYSLGVLLAELITGVNPQHTTGDSFADTYRRVVETGLPRPRALTKGIARDLDAIVTKATARHPADRYASVAELRADVQRWLDGRPVLAQTPSGLYVVGKLMRRHKALSAATAALVLLSATAAIVFVRQAQIERRRFDDARRLINAVVQEIQPKLESIPATLPLRQTLIERTMTYLESVSRDAGDNVDLLVELANAYGQLARVQGDVSTSTLGNQAQAAERFRRGEALMSRAVSIAPSNPAVLKEAALFYGRLAGFENTQSKTEQSAAHGRMSVEFAERRLALLPGDFDAREVLAFSVFNMALGAPAGDWDLRVATFRRAGDLYRALAAELPEKVNLQRNSAIADRFLASLHNDRRLTGEARRYGERALTASEQLLRNRPDDAALKLEAGTDAWILAMILDADGDPTGAHRHYERAIALDEAVLAADPSNVRATILLADARRHFARNRLLAEDTAAARREVQRAVDAFEALRASGRLPSVGNWRLATALSTLGDIERTEGHTAQACTSYTRAAELFDATNREAPLVDLVKADADRTSSHVSECTSGPRR